MTHSNAALRSLAVAVSAAQQRCRLAALSLLAGGVLLAFERLDRHSALGLGQIEAGACGIESGDD